MNDSLRISIILIVDTVKLPYTDYRFQIIKLVYAIPNPDNAY